jgi:hypothetical protein
MIPHQDVSMDRPTGLLASLTHGLQKKAAVRIVLEDVLPVIAARHDMIHGAGIFDS